MKITQVIMTAAIVIILLGSFALPIITDAQQEISPITEHNIGTGHTYREAKAGDVLELDIVVDLTTSVRSFEWTLNGKPVINDINSSLAWELALLSDALMIQAYAETNPSAAQWYSIKDPSVSGYAGASSTDGLGKWTITFNESTIDWVYVGGGAGTAPTNSFEYTWAYVPCTIEEGGYLSSSIASSTTAILENPNDVILCGNYITGELDTAYTFKDGVAFVSNSAYTGEYTPIVSDRAGTYDLYDVSIMFTISDGSTTEEFHPYRALIPYEVHGHASNTAEVNIIGILPVLVICSFIAVAVGTFVRSRY